MFAFFLYFGVKKVVDIGLFREKFNFENENLLLRVLIAFKTIYVNDMINKLAVLSYLKTSNLF